MVIIKRTEEIKTFYHKIIDMYMYDDTIYVLCNVEEHVYNVYTYIPGVPEKLIFTYRNESDNITVRFRYITNGPPDLVCVTRVWNGSLLHDVYNDTHVLLEGLSIDYSTNYRCYDRIFICTDSYGEKLMTYDIDTHVKTVYREFISDVHGMMCHNNKIYFLNVDLEYMTILFSSITSINDRHINEQAPTIPTYKYDIDNVITSIVTLFKIDDILYGINDYTGEIYCYDVEKKVHFVMDHQIDIFECPVINKKNTKLYSYIDSIIYEYDIIKNSLFKTSNLAYSDMTIKTVEVDE